VERLAATIAEAAAVKADWYTYEQQPEAVSPWRHHLRKRRLYVEGRLNTLVRERGEAVGDILDLGCGDGNNLAFLRRYAKRCWASDYNMVRLARAHARYQDAQFFLADILNYPVMDASMDVVFFNHVLEHMVEDEKALATVRRILKPDGLLILGIPNEGSWWWQLAYRRAPHTLMTSDHVQFYTAPIIRAKLMRQGFAVKTIHPLGWGPPDWEWDVRLRQSKLADDLFSAVGRALIPSQASSLYVLATPA
jgi:SAM-dependent methyltransferase